MKMHLLWIAKGSHFGGAVEQSETERASSLKQKHLRLILQVLLLV